MIHRDKNGEREALGYQGRHNFFLTFSSTGDKKSATMVWVY